MNQRWKLASLFLLPALAGCSSPSSSSPAEATGTLALHGAYAPAAGSVAAEFSALSFVSATEFSAMKAGCRGSHCREDGTYTYDGNRDLALTDHATGETEHVIVDARTLGSAGAGSAAQAKGSLSIADNLVGGSSGSLVNTSASSLLPSITAATMNGAAMQFVADDDPAPPTDGALVVPITSAPGSTTITIKVGRHGTPVQALLDTGSTGIWVASGILGPNDGIDQDETINQTYGGTQALTAEVKSFYVHLQAPDGTDIRTNGPIPVAVVNGASCPKGPGTCDDGTANGLPQIALASSNMHAVVGIALGRGPGLSGVVSPFGAIGQQSEQFVMHAGPAGNPSARVVIDPGPPELAEFTAPMFPLTGDQTNGFDSKAVPFAINGYQVTGALDSGESVGFVGDINDASEYDALGLTYSGGPLTSDEILLGIPITVTVLGIPAVQFDPLTQTTPGRNRLEVRANTPHNNLGILSFRGLDVFYDGWNGQVDVAPLSAD